MGKTFRREKTFDDWDETPRKGKGKGKSGRVKKAQKFRENRRKKDNLLNTYFANSHNDGDYE